MKTVNLAELNVNAAGEIVADASLNTAAPETGSETGETSGSGESDPDGSTVYHAHEEKENTAKRRGREKGDYFAVTQRVSTIRRILPNLGRKLKFLVSNKKPRSVEEIQAALAEAVANGKLAAAMGSGNGDEFLASLATVEMGGKITMDVMEEKFGKDYKHTIKRSDIFEYYQALAAGAWAKIKPHHAEADNGAGEDNGIYTDDNDPTIPREEEVAPVVTEVAEAVAAE